MSMFVYLTLVQKIVLLVEITMENSVVSIFRTNERNSKTLNGCHQ